MADPADRYRKLIDATLRAALTERLQRPSFPDGLTMEFALPAIAWRMGIIGDNDARVTESVHRVTSAPPLSTVRDGADQTRSTYRPLLRRIVAMVAPLGAFDARETDTSLATFARDAGDIRAVDGSTVVGLAFDALAAIAIRWRRQEPATSVALAALDRLITRQASDGTFLARTSADQLEPAWYHELAVLHAVDLYARQTGDPAAREAVKRSARYHAAEVQPDHASSHPFGLAALLDDPDGIFLADMMLHAAGCQQPSTMDAVSLVLLFDAIAPVAAQR